jgi:hypothetical protein
LLLSLLRRLSWLNLPLALLLQLLRRRCHRNLRGTRGGSRGTLRVSSEGIALRHVLLKCLWHMRPGGEAPELPRPLILVLLLVGLGGVAPEAGNGGTWPEASWASPC